MQPEEGPPPRTHTHAPLGMGGMGKVGYGVLVVWAGDGYLRLSPFSVVRRRGTAVQAALARMPKKEDSLELGREVGREGGRKKNGGHGPRIIS